MPSDTKAKRESAKCNWSITLLWSAETPLPELDIMAPPAPDWDETPEAPPRAEQLDDACKDYLAGFIATICPRLKKFLDHVGKNYVYQLEWATSLHVQGFLRTKTRKREQDLLNIFEQVTKLPRHALTLSPAHSSTKVAEYAAKDETRVSDPCYKIPPLEKYQGNDVAMVGDTPYPWQAQLLKEFRAKPDPRKITYVMEPEGNTGKSAFVKYCYLRVPAVILLDTGARAQQLAKAACNIVAAMRAGTDDTPPCNPRVVLIDLPRSQAGQVTPADMFNVAERIKNGNIGSTMYGAASREVFDPPHIVMFANTPPDTRGLSKDRWRLLTINEKKEFKPMDQGLLARQTAPAGWRFPTRAEVERNPEWRTHLLPCTKRSPKNHPPLQQLTVPDGEPDAPDGPEEKGQEGGSPPAPPRAKRQRDVDWTPRVEDAGAPSVPKRRCLTRAASPMDSAAELEEWEAAANRAQTHKQWVRKVSTLCRQHRAGEVIPPPVWFTIPKEYHPDFVRSKDPIAYVRVRRALSSAFGLDEDTFSEDSDRSDSDMDYDSDGSYSTVDSGHGQSSVERIERHGGSAVHFSP